MKIGLVIIFFSLTLTLSLSLSLSFSLSLPQLNAKINRQSFLIFPLSYCYEPYNRYNSSHMKNDKFPGESLYERR